MDEKKEEPKVLSVEDAFNTIANVCGEYRGTKKEHIAIDNCLRLVATAIGELRQTKESQKEEVESVEGEVVEDAPSLEILKQ